MAEQLKNAISHTTLNEALDDSETGVDVTDGSVFPSSGDFRVRVDDEIMKVTARSSNTLTVVRGAESTSAASHDDGATIKAVLSADALLQIIKENAPASPGSDLEFAYNEFTSNKNITATAEASADTVVTADAVTFDGSTPVLIEFYSNYIRPDTGGSNRNITCWLFEGSTSLGRLEYRPDADSQGHSAHMSRRLTPASGSRTYSVRATVNSGTGLIQGGAGGTGNPMPGYIRITRANPSVDGSGSVTTGTSFPSSPATGLRYRRSDIDYLIFFYDGTRWLSEKTYLMQVSQSEPTISGAKSFYQPFAHHGGKDLWLVEWVGARYVSTTNNGSNYWTISLKRFSDDGLLDSFTTSGDSASTTYDNTDAIGAVCTDGAGYIRYEKTGSPGDTYPLAGVIYRVIAT